MKTVAQTVIEADHFYTIAAHTGNVIQAVEGTKEAGTVRLGKYEHKPEQEWSFIRVGDGVYRIRNRASGKLLDLTMTGTANGTWLHLWEDVGGTSQMWTVQPTPEGTVRLRSSWAGGKCVDTVGMGAAVGTVLQIWQEVPGADDQLWTIAEVKERAKRAAKKAEAPAVEAAAEAAPAAEKAPAKKTAARKPRTTKRRLPPRQKLQKRGRQRPQHRQKSPQSLPVRPPQKRPPPRLPKKQSLQRQKHLQRKSPLRRSPSASAHPARRRRRSDLVLLIC
ncbi:MAG: RICIN domain-containing protein [Faecalibacterium sp.]